MSHKLSDDISQFNRPNDYNAVLKKRNSLCTNHYSYVVFPPVLTCYVMFVSEVLTASTYIYFLFLPVSSFIAFLAVMILLM